MGTINFYQDISLNNNDLLNRANDPTGGGGLTDFTSLYLPCDEADGTAEPVDESNFGLNVTRTGTGWAHSNLQAISGTTSLRANNIITDNTQYYTVDSSNGYRFESEDLTVEFWIRWATAPNASNFAPVFFATRNAPTNDMQLDYFNGNLEWDMNGGAFSFDFAFVPSINTWYHIAYTKEGTNCRCFVDGTQVGVTETGPASINNNGFNLNIGGDGFNDINFDGFIDEYRILKGKALYTSNFTAPTPPLGLYTEGAASPLTTKGDLYTYDTADQRLPIGTDGQILSANSATATGLEWIDNTGGRELLTANRTYYVSTTGSDSNDGLSVGSPFLTIQKAVDVVAMLDISIYDVTIQLADGTYTLTSDVILKDPIGAGFVFIDGNSGDNSLVVITGAGTANLFSANISNKYELRYLTFDDFPQRAVLGGNVSGSKVLVRDCRITNPGTRAFYAANTFGLIVFRGTLDYEYTSGTVETMFHCLAQGAAIEAQNLTITITGNPTFTDALASADRFSSINLINASNTGSHGGTRFNAERSSVILAMGVSGFSGSDSTASSGVIHTV